MLQQQNEKKVEYLELIYDLIFVYIIGRNNSLLHIVEGGFVSLDAFLAYALCTLAAIQIWNYSTFYINIYGRNGLRDHVFLCVNMFLLYFMGDGIGAHWQEDAVQYSIAWGLILVNLGIQHLIEIRNHRNAPWEVKQLKEKAAIILIEAVLIAVHILVFRGTGVSIAYVPIFFGIIAMMTASRLGTLVPVDFNHLTERAMLYVVFTFGEMIITLSGYFEGGFTLNTIFFAGMGFLIVVGLFLSYGTLYNKILDRERETSGVSYMALHIFLIFALNNISTALEFMREAEVALLPKTLFLTLSFVLYFSFLFVAGRYAKDSCRVDARYILTFAGGAALFVILMMLLRTNMYANITVTVLYVFWIWMETFRWGKRAE